MVYYKLDKLDKIVIALTFIIVTMSCIFNTFCFASEVENVVVNKLNNLIISSSGFITTSTGSLGYFPIEKGYRYTITQTAYEDATIRIGYTNDIPSKDLPVYDIQTLPYQGSYSFTAYDNKFLYFDYSWYNENMTITREKLTSLNDVSLNLSQNVSYNLWEVFENLIPYVLVVVLFSLGVWFIKHNIIEHSKGRDF